MLIREDSNTALFLIHADAVKIVPGFTIISLFISRICKIPMYVGRKEKKESSRHFL